MSTIQIRIDEKTKRGAKRVLDKIGIDMSAAIKLYLRQVMIQKSIPLNLVTENGLAASEEVDILKAWLEAQDGKGLSRKVDASEAKGYLRSLR